MREDALDERLEDHVRRTVAIGSFQPARVAKFLETAFP
jgi:hypothetical protein